MSIENERELEERNRELLERLELTHIIESHQ
jgi:thiol-disulfide isomerase/thioredoxin